MSSARIGNNDFDEEYVFLSTSDLTGDGTERELFIKAFNDNDEANRKLPLDSIVLYEKMVESTSTWQTDNKFIKTPANRKDFSVNPSFAHNLPKKKSSKTSASLIQSWATIFTNMQLEVAVGYWAVTEKVHGANFCFVYDVANGTVSPAKRSALLETDDDFFGYRSAYEAELPKVMAIFQQTAARYPAATLIYAFAELFGGVYPAADHASVNRFSEVSLEEVVQREIQYSPDLHFYHFDIAVQQQGTGNSSDKVYLNYMDAAVIWESAAVLWAKPLFVGCFEEVTNCGVDFQTTIPSQLGLKPVPDNAAEGVVIKPLVEVSVKQRSGISGAGDRHSKTTAAATGRRVLSSERAIVKRKALKFLEKVTVMNNNSAALAGNRKRGAASGGGGSKYQDNETQYHAVLAHMMSYVNVNRLAAARSKLGSRVAPGVVVGAVIQDVLSTVEAEEGGENDEGVSLWAQWTQGLRPTQRDAIVHKLEVAVTQLLSKTR